MNRLVPSIAAPKEIMIDTMIGHGTRPMAQHYGQTARTLLVIAHETEAMCTKALMPNGYETRRETETTDLLVNANGHGIQIDAITMTEDPQRKNLNESVIGLNMSVHRGKNITIIANLKSLNGRNLATGLIGKKTKNMSVRESATDVIGIVIVKENTTDHLTRPPATAAVVRRKDIPILVELVLCRIVTTAVVVLAIWRLLVQRRTETIIELINPSHPTRCRSSHSPEDTAMV